LEKVRPGEFPFTLPFLTDGRFHFEFSEPVTVVVGENGSGKSTFLETLAALCGFNAQGGSQDNRFGEAEDLAPLGVAQALRSASLPKVGRVFFFRAERFYNFPRYIQEAYSSAGLASPYGRDNEMHRLSHGEMFLDFIDRRFGHGTRAVYLLDEPEAAL